MAAMDQLKEELAQLEVEKRELEKSIPKRRAEAEEDAWQ
jgi:hypothetical protein